MTISKQILDDLKSFDWQKIIDYGNSLDNLDDGQFRFLKGFSLELMVEKYSNKNFKYVGLTHRDFDWQKYNLSVEQKSEFSRTLYKKDGKLRKTFNIKLTNSHGTNSEEKANPKDLSDVLLVIRNDGVFIADKSTVMSSLRNGSDGWMVKIKNTDIIEISGKILPKIKYISKLRQEVENAVLKDLP